MKLDPALVAILLPLLRPGLGVLSEGILALIEACSPADAGDQYSRVAYQVVRQIGEAHPEWPDTEKKRYAIDAVQHSTGLADSFAAALVEVAVLAIKQERMAGNG